MLKVRRRMRHKLHSFLPKGTRSFNRYPTLLFQREMNSIFNKLLIFLAVFDNLYIICSVLEGRRKQNEEFDQVTAAVGQEQ